MRRIDPWQLLNVRPGDAADTLKSNYKAAMLNAHPDRGGTDEAASILNRAYEFLSSKLVNGKVPGPLEAGLRPAMPRPPPQQRGWRIVQVVVVNGGATTTNNTATTSFYGIPRDPWGPTGGWR